MKKKFQIAIHASGVLNESFIKAITSHADGKISLDLDILEAFVKANDPNLVRAKQNEGDNSLDIYEGKKHTMTIYEKVYFELHPIDKEIDNVL